MATQTFNTLRSGIFAMLLLGGFPGIAQAADDPDFADSLIGLSLEELLDVQVAIVSKKPTSISTTPAAVTVISAEDIRRSGARTLPEILRQAPGVQAAQQNANYWGVSIRGFNDSFANKLLVMMDGRSLYTPLFSGTFWDVQDTLLEDIERIEIVRGPGSTVWGANAVNGVVNIITKSAKDTQGTLAVVGGGAERHADIGLRHGLKVGDDLFLRFYGKYTDQDDLAPTGGIGGNDGYYLGRGGFRMDWLPEDGVRATLQGDIYGGKVRNDYLAFPTLPGGAPTPSVGGVGGGNALGRVEKDLANDGMLTLQAYYDRTVRQTAVFDETRDTGDVELQGYLPLGERHELTAGLGYRASADRLGRTATISFFESERVTHLTSAFVQDAIQLAPERLTLSLGSKFEHNQFTGFEAQPGARLSYALATNHTVWLAVTRAVRTPSRAEDDIRVNRMAPPGIPVRIVGQRGAEAEDLIAYEMGFRTTLNPRVTLETAAFYNEYDNLRALNTGPSAAGGFAADLRQGNEMTGETYGVEISPSVQLREGWRLRANYSFLQMQLHLPPGHTDASAPLEERQSPHHTVTLSSHMNLPRDVDLDVFARYVDHIFVPRANNGAGAGIPAYWNLDVRLGWRPTENLEFSLMGRNLLDSSRPEFRETFISASSSQVQRSIFGVMTYRF